jgi:hypothetical protein
MMTTVGQCLKIQLVDIDDFINKVKIIVTQADRTYTRSRPSPAAKISDKMH